MVHSLSTLHSRGSAIASASSQRRELSRLKLVREFQHALRHVELHPLRPLRIDTLQVNVGRLCNQTCAHCHVDAGPDRSEVMSRDTLSLCLAALDRSDIPVVDITGGAPELNPNFRWFVQEVRARGRHVIDRCNLTIIESGAHRDLPEFFAKHKVEVVASLPHYDRATTDGQRGDGVFDKSIAALKRLNAVGYGDGDSGLRLVLVTNPTGTCLPACQVALESEWKRELRARHQIRFDQLHTLTNMPISRFLEWLLQSDNLQPYMDKLVSSFNPAAANGVMCRNTLSVAWDGRLHDCDFNQMLELPLDAAAPQHIRDFDLESLQRREVQLGRHCYGCTAGAGSSCRGATA